MRIACWNINNRGGAVPFRPEAADAAMALDADALFFCEYFAREHGPVFRTRLAAGGWSAQLLSPATRGATDRVLVASRVPVTADPFPRPAFDGQLAASMIVARFPAMDLRVLALRVPDYGLRQRQSLARAWDWIEYAANILRNERALIIGDLNCSLASPRQRGGDHLQRIIDSGWTLGTPATGASYYGLGGRNSVLDHLLLSPACSAWQARFVAHAGGYQLAGARGALSAHAALVADVAMAGALPGEIPPGPV